MNGKAPGTLFIVSAPSGAGKTSLLKALLKVSDGLCVSVSHTTRPKRAGETDGVDYHFVDPDTFTRMVEGGEFLEYAQVFDNYYGTTESNIRNQLEAGVDVILEIDWQGARQVRTRFPNAISIFVIPPSRETLRERLGSRGQDSEAVIERRMRDAIAEMTHYPEYDYLVANDQFDQALQEIGSLITAQRLRCPAQVQRLQVVLEGLLN